MQRSQLRGTCVPEISIRFSGDEVAAGEAYLVETPVLRLHAGRQPDLFLRWNAVPVAATAIDVIVHLHGFSQQRGDMLLSEKVPRSGLDLSGRIRPTLALLPRGNWIRHTYYDFPGLLDGGLDLRVVIGRVFHKDRYESRYGLDHMMSVPHIVNKLTADGVPAVQIDDVDAIAGRVATDAQRDDVVVVMSSGAFGGVHEKLLERLRDQR